MARKGAPLVPLGWYFLLMGLVMGHWAALIPAIAVMSVANILFSLSLSPFARLITTTLLLPRW